MEPEIGYKVCFVDGTKGEILSPAYRRRPVRYHIRLWAETPKSSAKRGYFLFYFRYVPTRRHF